MGGEGKPSCLPLTPAEMHPSSLLTSLEHHSAMISDAVKKVIKVGKVRGCPGEPGRGGGGVGGSEAARGRLERFLLAMLTAVGGRPGWAAWVLLALGVCPVPFLQLLWTPD